MDVPPVSRPIRTRCRPSRQDAVERAEAYLRAHLDAPVAVSSLGRIIGLSERGLRDAFQHVRGTSPKRWFVAVRLQGVRSVLCDEAARPTTVASAATEYGFFELGRFAALYRGAFGEVPSATLRSTGRRTGHSALPKNAAETRG